MKADSGHIFDVWTGAGVLAGPDKRPNGYVTVEQAYWLNESVGPVGTYKKLPVRWFARADNSQIETVIPNVKSVAMQKSLDTDAWEATIQVRNQDMMFGLPTELGRPGWFTPDRGDSPEALSRWGHIPNEWHGVLVEGALLRTYEGFGGRSKTLAQALTDGNVVRTGTWLVDKATIGTDGFVQLQCRNMAELAIDQPVSDELIPATATDGGQVYPLAYSRFFDRWVENGRAAYGNVITNTKWIVGMAVGPVEGYWIVGSDGGIFTYGLNFFYGSRGGLAPGNNIVGMASTPSGLGYWLVDATGAVFSFGDATYEGGASGLGAPIVGIAAHPTGMGYYLVGTDGGVFTYGSAVFHGSLPATSNPIVDIMVRPQGDGYWLVDSAGGVFTYGTIPFYGAGPTLTGGHTVTGADVTPSGGGYILVSDNGGVFTYGDAVFHGSLVGTTLNDPITDVAIHPDNAGYWLVARDGGIFTFGAIPFLGSLPGNSAIDFPMDGNYFDFVDIVKELLLWAGFWLYPNVEIDGKPTVNGNLETTGTYSSLALAPEIFDKKPVIDGITALKEIVGYVFFVDDDGAARFVSPNYFTRGNNLDSGTRTAVTADVDERKQLTDYTVEHDSGVLRSNITVTCYNCDTGVMETTTYTPPGSDNLRGRKEPIKINPPVYLSEAERLTMAKLVSMHIWFRRRVGSVKCLANPLLELDDQARIWERQTAETYIHYVRGITSEHDFEDGKYFMTLTTHHLGDEHAWAADLFA